MMGVNFLKLKQLGIFIFRPMMSYVNVYFLETNQITLPPRVKVHPDVDLLSLILVI